MIYTLSNTAGIILTEAECVWAYHIPERNLDSRNEAYDFFDDGELWMPITPRLTRIEIGVTERVTR